MNLEITDSFLTRLLRKYALPSLEEYGVRDLYVQMDANRITLKAILLFIPLSISISIVGYTSRRIHFSLGSPFDALLRFFHYENDMVKVRYGVITLDLSGLDIPGRIRKIRVSRGRLLISIR